MAKQSAVLNAARKSAKTSSQAPSASSRGSTGVLDRLAGKKVVFNGKFAWGVEESLKAMAKAQQGKVKDDVDASTDYLVLADLNAGKTVQKKAMALNAKGAAIQVLDGDAFKKLAEPTEQEILALLRCGKSEAIAEIYGTVSYQHWGYAPTTPKYLFTGEKLDGVKLKNASFDEIGFERCSLAGAELEGASIPLAKECDFTGATGQGMTFYDVSGSKFRDVSLKGAMFEVDITGADFSGATIEGVTFEITFAGTRKPKPSAGVVFRKAVLRRAEFRSLNLQSPNFEGADLTGATFTQCTLESATMRGAVLKNAAMLGCKFKGSDFRDADLSGANLVDADLTGVNLVGADLKGANLRGAKLDGVDLSKAKNYDPSATAGGSAGPALKELDGINKKAKRVQISFKVRNGAEDEGEEAGVDSNGLKYGWGLRLPSNLGSAHGYQKVSSQLMSDAILSLANLLGNRRVRFESVEVSSTKSPKGGKELKDLAIQAISEAFGQMVPDEKELAEATKAYRGVVSKAGEAARKAREKAKAEEEKRKEKEKKQIAKKIEKAVGKVTDTASFLKALEVRIEKPKIQKATSMLKASGFKLFNDVTGEHVSGVVKSQTDPDLVYACRISNDGHYACCTQNLNVCGGLRGSACKHLLVLIIGLVQAGELEPTTIDEWLAKSHDVKPELDKETMGAIFIKYKGAEAGEVDWRPTETVPEDYYSL